MSLKVLHTADWHLGQTFFEFDRTYEHQQFLSWLLCALKDKEIDLLLLSGDVFDVSNPSAASVRIFYDFLRDAVRQCPSLQIVVVAGNHDSPARLEMPKPLLEAFSIHVVGAIERKADGQIDFEKFVFPVHNKSGAIEAWCMAVPFLRICDFDHYNGENLAENVSEIYRAAYNYVSSLKSPNQAVIATGHLHAVNASISENDKSERLLMGGQEFVPANAFHADITYVALGHIHKAQKINGCEHIRYAGSPLPMSFSEINYKHQLVFFEIENAKLQKLEVLEVPLAVELLKVPLQHSTIDDVLLQLASLPEKNGNDQLAPYLEVRLLLSGPEPALRHRIESILATRNVRLAKIDARYQRAENLKEEAISLEKFQELKPVTVFEKIYKKRYDNDVPEVLLDLFRQVEQNIKTEEPNGNLR